LDELSPYVRPRSLAALKRTKVWRACGVCTGRRCSRAVVSIGGAQMFVTRGLEKSDQCIAELARQRPALEAFFKRPDVRHGATAATRSDLEARACNVGACAVLSR
jgi:hypothetical protein